MKRLMVGMAALAVLIAPQSAFSKKVAEGSGQARTASAHQLAAPTPNFHASGTGTAVSCGSGCTAVSGTYSGDQLSGTFEGRLTVTSSAGCSVLHGLVLLNSGSDSAIAGVSGTQCGTVLFGSYWFTDGTGAYQENGAGWGDFSVVTSRAGAFQMSASGMFFPQQPRQ